MVPWQDDRLDHSKCFGREGRQLPVLCPLGDGLGSSRICRDPD